MTDVVSRGRDPLQVAAVLEVSPTGIVIDEEIRFNDWRELVAELNEAGDQLLWARADAVAFGLRKLKRDPSWLIYRTMIEQLVAKGTLWNIASVARRVESSRRREDLSFSHHAEVAAFEPDEQEAWLADAVRHNWSVRELRDEIQRARDGRKPEPALSVRLVEDYYRIAVAKAERRGMDPKDWLLEAIRNYDGPAPIEEAA